MRIQKFMAECGIASRRKSEKMIAKGLVQVNGVLIKEPGFPIDPEQDEIIVAGEKITRNSKIYIMINKPKGALSTSEDTHGRQRVLDLVPIKERLYTVGRLDMDTEGLLLLTNDGDLTFYLTHPKHEFEKVYVGLVKGCPDQKSIDLFKRGMAIEDYRTAPADIKIMARNRDTSRLEMRIHEGKKRQIRKMCAAMGCPIIDLKRVAIGKLTLGGLNPGEWRYLTSDEIKYLKGDSGNGENRIPKRV
ncbi:pseudouridine synthase [Acetobacterium woodii]|uniref:Pseudouridine synthase n=1 Tax=Acetobacterium woodii (strain ATCC 29683 / DSM 1030 / JCM 2381 / KCTC 1655 / WB1) TaxID=931626 RepID=H6LCH6_ACEWD|nr:pseudouridine synthase [Acetobacterium woodii]AFA47758.1 ribosomal large subunit pseudouridine synthase B [Acetobacterium woodii DSM 1030]